MNYKQESNIDDQPDNSVGYCPECGGHVYQYGQSFCCQWLQEGACSFRINVSGDYPSLLGSDILSPDVMRDMLRGNATQLHTKSIDFPISYWGKIMQLGNNGWGIQIFTHNPDTRKTVSPVRRKRPTV